MKTIRSPIVSVLGHVDHGKSSILDAIRNSNICATEAGAITQAIGASKVPLEAVKDCCGEDLLKHLNMEFTIPGLLFIDTPGHAAFTSLRKRGGALADIAILVVDINEGFKPQTIEAIEILKGSKTPFIMAANKLDLVSNYSQKSKFLIPDLNQQNEQATANIETKMYELVGQLHEKFQLDADRFDRVDDFTKKVAIVPCSAIKKIGVPELLMVVTGLAQKYFEDQLKINVSGPAKGTVLEVKEEKGLGTTIDVIIYDGTLDVNDTIVIGGLNGPIVTKVRALLEPADMTEIRDKKSKFINMDHIAAATGVKIVAPILDGVLAGMPMHEVGDNLEATKKEVQTEVESVLIETDKDGIMVKADSIGSLEAVLQILKEKEIPVARASVGAISKKDMTMALSAKEQDPLHGVILGFNIPEAKQEGLKIITGDIIYRILEEFEEWKVENEKQLKDSEAGALTKPCRIEFLKNHSFRQSGPAIFGVEILAGELTVGTKLIKKDGSNVGLVRTMKSEKDSVNKAKKGERLAISVPDVTIGRQVNEGDILLSDINEKDFRQLKDFKKHLKPEELEIMKELATLRRKENPVWGV